MNPGILSLDENPMVMMCSQCGAKALRYYPEEKIYLCIDCDLKLQESIDRQQARLADTLNYLKVQMEATTGVFGVLPRYEVTRPTIHAGPMTQHNIQIHGSVVGAINTGQIKNLNVALDNVQNAGSPDLANALQKLTEAVLASSELAPEKKMAAIEHLSHIAGQAALQKEQRQAAISTTIIEGFERIINVSSGLLSIWNTVKPLIENLF